MRACSKYLYKMCKGYAYSYPIVHTVVVYSYDVMHSVSQCVAVCCSVLQCVAVCCSVLQCVAVCCSVLQCVAVCCMCDNVSQCDCVFI